MRTDILGVKFDNMTMDKALSEAVLIMENRKRGYVVTPNPEIVWMCRKDGRLRAAVNGAALVLADGIGIIYGARILGRPLKERIPGIDFASRLMEIMAYSEKSAFLLGAAPGVAELAGEQLEERYPGLRIAGTAHGYFQDDAEILEKINAASPDFLVVAMGAPRQEYWMSENICKLDIGLAVGLGGALDVFAGNVRRAPEGWRRLGLEWLYRLIKEPRRIKRMLKLPMFLFAVIGRRIRGKVEE